MREDEKRAADLYDLQIKVYGQGSIDQMNVEIPSLIHVIKENGLFTGNVLDVGVGTGQLALALLKVLETKVQVSGFDISEENIAEFKRVTKDDERVASAEVASFYDIPYEDNSFDSAISNHTLHYAEDLLAALKEIRKKIKTVATLCSPVLYASKATLKILFMVYWYMKHLQSLFEFGPTSARRRTS